MGELNLLACTHGLLRLNFFFYNAGPPDQDSIMHTVPPHQSLIKKIPSCLPTGQSNGNIFSTEFLSSQMTLTCVKLTRI